MESPAVLWISMVFVALALFFARGRGRYVTAPMLLVAVGALLGPERLELGTAASLSNRARPLLEFALGLLVFSSATDIHRQRFRREWRPSLRLLLFGIPLTIALTTVLGLALFPSATFAMALLCAAALAPGDTETIRPFVESEDAPRTVVDVLKIENGLGDAVIASAFSVGLGLMAGEGGASGESGIALLVRGVVVGLASGAVVGLIGALIVERIAAARAETREPLQAATLGLAILAYSSAVTFGGSGIVASFAGGVVLSNTSRTAFETARGFSERTGRMLVLLAFLFTGALVVPRLLATITWRSAAFALSVLLVVRPLAVATSLIGLRLGTATVLSFGWFGARGLPSLLLALLFLEQYRAPDGRGLVEVIELTMVLSVFLHGFSSYPAALAWRRRDAVPTGAAVQR